MDALSDPYEWYRQQLISQTTQQALNDQQATQRRQVSNTEAQQFQLMLQERLDKGAQARTGQLGQNFTRNTAMSELPINPSLESKHEYFTPANQAKLGQALQADPEAKALFESLAAQQNPSDASIKQLIGQLKGHFEPGTGKGSEQILGQNVAGTQVGKGGEPLSGQSAVTGAQPGQAGAVLPGQSVAGAQAGKGGGPLSGQSVVAGAQPGQAGAVLPGQGVPTGSQPGQVGDQVLGQNVAGAQVGKGGEPLSGSPESLLGKLANEEGGIPMDKLRSSAGAQTAGTYVTPESEARLNALLAQNPEAKALFDQMVQQQLSPQLRAFLTELAPGQLAQLANLTPQELTHLEKGGAEKLLAKLGISPETLNNLSALKEGDIARLGELKELIQQFSRSTATNTGQQGVPQGPIGDAILAALNSPVAPEVTAENVLRSASAEARVAQIGNLVAERILVTNPELGQKQEVLIMLKQDVLPGTQIKLSREGDVLHIAFQARGEDTANFISQNSGQLKDLLQTRLGEAVNVAVKTDKEQREENEGRSRNQRSVMDEMQDDESPA